MKTAKEKQVETDQKSLPGIREERNRLLAIVRDYVKEQKLVPPLSMEEMVPHADKVVELSGAEVGLRDFIIVLVGNEVWRDTMAAIPFERRILLLPKCLRSVGECQAEIDEFGLLCKECGRCPIGKLQAEAEDLGYVVLIAEGATVVTKLLESGKVDAVIGVSCMETLERSFPHMAADAIPGIAIPLFMDGCVNTKVDLDWVRDALRLRSNGKWAGRLDFDKLRSDVESWFNSSSILSFINSSGTPTEKIALSWLGKTGKRWRPLLSACVFRALNDMDPIIPEPMKKLAVAVECFHKASLVHDDIEDNDDFRYGDMTLHRQYGIPIALNVGDLLLGIGYGLIADSGLTEGNTLEALKVASAGHHGLCLGQGDELSWMRKREALSLEQVLNIFSLKTVPAFNVALQLGAIGAGAGSDIRDVLETFSKSLGIGYQIRDDILDFRQMGDGSDVNSLRPSVLFALVCENSANAEKENVINLWHLQAREEHVVNEIRRIFTGLHVEEKAVQLLHHYRNEAIRSLNPLRNAYLKTFLRRIVSRILGDV
ncbi:MAG: polyprenyl synthetase family protein [Kiritimatiellae bacterium]|nr:polyprenyl synthetase family protein [Kiritimatiellia bacterium]MDD5520952.1 polyprenyl synthetase family protein [Kiritimatiellia bacterium]